MSRKHRAERAPGEDKMEADMALAVRLAGEVRDRVQDLLALTADLQEELHRGRDAEPTGS